jgi:TM2 domain-containing membrane protein YozV
LLSLAVLERRLMDRRWNAVILSLIPGAGHLYLGYPGKALTWAILTLFSFWILWPFAAISCWSLGKKTLMAEDIEAIRRASDGRTPAWMPPWMPPSELSKNETKSINSDSWIHNLPKIRENSDGRTDNLPELSERAAISTDSNDVITQLEKLSKLKEKGILTEEEFQAHKKKILGM